MANIFQLLNIYYCCLHFVKRIRELKIGNAAPNIVFDLTVFDGSEENKVQSILIIKFRKSLE